MSSSILKPIQNNQPKQWNSLKPTSISVKEGTQLKLICEAEGNPEQFHYKWSVDDHNVNGRYSKV